MSKILVLDGEPLKTMAEVSIWLQESYQYEPVDIQFNERENRIEMEPTRDGDENDYHTFYSFEDMLKFIGEDCMDFITEEQDKEA